MPKKRRLSPHYAGAIAATAVVVGLGLLGLAGSGMALFVGSAGIANALDPSCHVRLRSHNAELADPELQIDLAVSPSEWPQLLKDLRTLSQDLDLSFRGRVTGEAPKVISASICSRQGVAIEIRGIVNQPPEPAGRFGDGVPWLKVYQDKDADWRPTTRRFLGQLQQRWPGRFSVPTDAAELTPPAAVAAV